MEASHSYTAKYSAHNIRYEFAGYYGTYKSEYHTNYCYKREQRVETKTVFSRSLITY